MKKYIEKEKTETIGSFQGIAVPKIKLFPMVLTEIIETTTNTKTNEKTVENSFNIRIDASNIIPSKLQELHEVVQDATLMKFPPYNRMAKEYFFYTNAYQSIEQKKEILNNLFDSLKEFEIQYNIDNKNSLKLFKKDSNKKMEYKDHEISVRYNEKINAFIVVSLGYLGREKYILLANASSKTNKLSYLNLDKEDFADLKLGKKDPVAFIINPVSYNSIKEFIEIKEKEHMEFAQEQKEIVSKLKDIPNYEEDNIFNFKIKLNKETNCFNFYCKGYSESTNPVTGHSVPRTLLASWALNFILSEEVSNEKYQEVVNLNYGNVIDQKDYLYDGGLKLDNYLKINLNLLETTNKRERNLVFSASEIDKVHKIFNNFKREQQLFGRPQKTLKVSNDFLNWQSGNVNLKEYPAIFLTQKGTYNFTYAYRESKDKFDESGNLKKVSQTTMDSVEISKEEYDMYMNTHPWAEKIRTNTIFLNTQIWMQTEGKNIIDAERPEMFKNIELRTELLRKNANNRVIKKQKL